MNWIGEVAAEIDRLVVGVYGQVSLGLADGFEFPNAHPALVLAVGCPLLQGPVAVGGLAATYPYLPSSMLEMLVQNNVDEDAITVVDGVMALTERGRGAAIRVRALFDEIPRAWWKDTPIADVESTASAVFAHASSLPPLAEPSAFSVQALIDAPTSSARVFRTITALRYWRADAHRAAWADAGLSVQEAHALNRLWDLQRGVERVGQGEPRPGRNGVAGLTEKGFAEGEAITDVGIKAREAIEAGTDTRTEPIYAPLDDTGRAAFLDGLRQLPI